MTPAFYYTNILSAAFLTISFCQKNYKYKPKVQKRCSSNFCKKKTARKMLLIATPGFRPSFSLPTDCQPGLDSLIGRNGGRDETSSRLKSSKVFEKKIIVQISIENFFQLSNVCFVNFHKFCSNRKMVLSTVICEKIIKSFTSCSVANVTSFIDIHISNFVYRSPR